MTPEPQTLIRAITLPASRADDLSMSHIAEETRSRVLLHFIVCYHLADMSFQSPETVQNAITAKDSNTFSQIKQAIATLEVEGLLEKRLSEEQGFGELPYDTWRLDSDAYLRSQGPPLPLPGPRLRPSNLARRLT